MERPLLLRLSDSGVLRAVLSKDDEQKSRILFPLDPGEIAFAGHVIQQERVAGLKGDRLAVGDTDADIAFQQNCQLLPRPRVETLVPSGGRAVRKRLAEEGISADTPSGWDGGAKSRISKSITVNFSEFHTIFPSGIVQRGGPARQPGTNVERRFVFAARFRVSYALSFIPSRTTWRRWSSG
jgi:hypothetical protein